MTQATPTACGFDTSRALSAGGRHRDGLLREAVEEVAAVLRESALEAESEFVEIRLQVGRGEGTLVRAAQPAFAQGDDQRNGVEFRAGSLAASGLDVSTVSKFLRL